jgi:hypothetical protein
MDSGRAGLEVGTATAATPRARELFLLGLQTRTKHVWHFVGQRQGPEFRIHKSVQGVQHRLKPAEDSVGCCASECDEELRQTARRGRTCQDTI